jgi:hypothetical protein
MISLNTTKSQARFLLLSAALFALGISLLLISCGTSGSGCIGATPVPKLSSVNPTTINSQSLPAIIMLSGSGFVSWSVAYLNSVNLSSATIDSHHINATLTWQDLSAAGISTGTLYIGVTNAGQVAGDVFGCPNGGSTQTIPITIN